MITYPKKFYAGASTQPWEISTDEGLLDHGIYVACGAIAELEIFGTGVGAAMTREIDSSPHAIEVIRGKENACILNGDVASACYQELFNEELLVLTLARALNGPAFHYASPAGIWLRELVGREAAHFRFIEVKSKAKDHNEVIVTHLATTLQARGKICYAIRDQLTRGGGAPAIVRWNHEQALADGGAGVITAAWNRRPPWIALAHELIHAWRLVTGTCIFPMATESAYEEAMTVGLFPYNGTPYTENAFRVAAGEPVRTFYGLSDAPTSQVGWISATASPWKHRKDFL